MLGSVCMAAFLACVAPIQEAVKQPEHAAPKPDKYCLGECEDMSLTGLHRRCVWKFEACAKKEELKRSRGGK